MSSSYRLSTLILRAAGVRPGRFSLGRADFVREIELPGIGSGNGWHEPAGQNYVSMTGRPCRVGDLPVLAMLASRPRRSGDGATCGVCSVLTDRIAVVLRWCQHDAHAPSMQSAGICPSCTVALWTTRRMRHGLTTLDASVARSIRARSMRASVANVVWQTSTMDALDRIAAELDPESVAAARTLRQRETAWHANRRPVLRPVKTDGAKARAAHTPGRMLRDMMRPTVERIVHPSVSDWRAALQAECAALTERAERGSLTREEAEQRRQYLVRRISELLADRIMESVPV